MLKHSDILIVGWFIAPHIFQLDTECSIHFLFCCGIESRALDIRKRWKAREEKKNVVSGKKCYLSWISSLFSILITFCPAQNWFRSYRIVAVIYSLFTNLFSRTIRNANNHTNGGELISPYYPLFAPIQWGNWAKSSKIKEIDLVCVCISVPVFSVSLCTGIEKYSKILAYTINA